MTALTLPLLKSYLRYEADDTSQDDALGLVLGGARRWVENHTGHILSRRLVSEAPPAFGSSFLPLRWQPYVPGSLDVSYLDAGHAAQSFEDFVVYPALGGWRVKPTSAWPAASGGITLTYMAGYEDAYAIPEDLMLAVALHAGMSDAERADMSSQGWKSLLALLEQYRLPSLA